MARAVRLGYNVLTTDNDVVIFDDLYTYLKSPPFNSFSVINQAEDPDSCKPSKCQFDYSTGILVRSMYWLCANSYIFSTVCHPVSVC